MAKQQVSLGAPILILFLSGCANWALQDRCEKTNWFEYSQGVAFKGNYLEEDGFVKACKGIDSISATQVDLGFKLGREKMCQYDEIFNRAKEGTPVFFKFCDGLDMNRMKQLYQQGLVSYCTGEKGYSFGKDGKIYQNLCNPQQEKAFLPGYYKGRKEYLISYMNLLRGQVEEFKKLEGNYALTETRVHMEYATLPANATQCRFETVFNSATQKNENRTVCEEAPYIRARRSVLWSQLDSVRGELREVRAKWKDAEMKIAQAQMDYNAVP